MSNNIERKNYPYPSRFGSHKTMIDVPLTAALGDRTQVVLRDEFEAYTTTRDSLDNGCADPRRYAEDRLTRLQS